MPVHVAVHEPRTWIAREESDRYTPESIHCHRVPSNRILLLFDFGNLRLRTVSSVRPVNHLELGPVHVEWMYIIRQVQNRHFHHAIVWCSHCIHVASIRASIHRVRRVLRRHGQHRGRLWRDICRSIDQAHRLAVLAPLFHLDFKSHPHVRLFRLDLLNWHELCVVEWLDVRAAILFSISHLCILLAVSERACQVELERAHFRERAALQFAWMRQFLSVSFRAFTSTLYRYPMAT